MEFFIQDWKGFFQDPKDTFKRISTYESINVPTVLMIVAGILMGVRRVMVAGEHMQGKDVIMPYDLGLRDANYVMAVLTPVIVIVCWYICSFIVNEVAEKMGALKGEFPEILMASGYLSYPIIAYELITLPLFYFGEVKNIGFLSTINTILSVVFIIWIFFLMSQIIEVICEVPFSISFVSLMVTFLGFTAMYYGVIEMVLNRMLLVNIFQGRHL